MARRSTIEEIPTALSMAYRGRRCFHAFSGRAPEHKMCGANHECGKCEFDQMLDDMNQTKPASAWSERAVVPAA